MIARRLKVVILIYLWAALLEDTSLSLIAWLVPDLWFRLLHGVAPAGFDIAFLRRFGGAMGSLCTRPRHCTRVLEEETNLARHRRRSAFFRLVH